MEKIYVKHYILGTYSEDQTPNYRGMDMSEVVSRYEKVTTRIKRALLANEIEDPEKLITYSFRMLGDFQGQTFHRKELVEINLDMLKADLFGFQWENWGWVQAFQPIVDVAGYTIVEIDSEYPSFGPAPTASVDYIQPCYRIYEGGNPDWNTYEHPKQERTEEKDEGWFAKFKKEVITPTGEAIKENIPTILAVITTVAAITVMLRTARESVDMAERAAERSEEILRHIEDTIDDAIDMPQVVKVELGDDIEIIGTGRRSW